VKLMLTSFGIEQPLSSISDEESMFYRMPPVSFRWSNESFAPNYELLLLCDKVVMDESSFGRLVEHPTRAYTKVAETFKALNGEGRIELVDFLSVLRGNEELLNRMLDHDIKVLDQWVVPLRESLAIWKRFSTKSVERMPGYGDFSVDASRYQNCLDDMSTSIDTHPGLLPLSWFVHSYIRPVNVAKPETQQRSSMVDEALASSKKRKRKEYRGALREVLRGYLTYVNANLILSNELEVGFHDWQDFFPFYSLKFLSVGKDEDRVEGSRRQVEKLFTVPFPDLAIRDTSALLHALGDKRIEDLRQLISDAVLGKVEFDEQFAKSVLSEVFRSERKSREFRRILGYLTLPVGFVPWIGTLAQKGVEEVVGAPIEKKIKQKHQWFYMLSDIADRHQGPAEE